MTTDQNAQEGASMAQIDPLSSREDGMPGTLRQCWELLTLQRERISALTMDKYVVERILEHVRDEVGQALDEMGAACQIRDYPYAAGYATGTLRSVRAYIPSLALHANLELREPGNEPTPSDDADDTYGAF